MDFDRTPETRRPPPQNQTTSAAPVRPPAPPLTPNEFLASLQRAQQQREDFARRRKDADELRDAVRAARAKTPGATDALLKLLTRLRTRPDFDIVSFWAHDRGRGDNFAHELMLTFQQDLPTRQKLAALLDLPDPATLTFDAFAEQLTVSLAYSDRDDLEDAKQSRDPNDPAALLKAFGYRARPAIYGGWGLQMRVFEPRDDVEATFDDTFVTFRGTESILPGPLASVTGNTRESALDTDIGDFNRLGVGYGQYLPNDELIEHNLRLAARTARPGRVIVTGHSLGGALAQIAACRVPETVRFVLTWASPGIDLRDVLSLKRWNSRQPEEERVGARFYRTTTDVVPLAGQARIEGHVYTFERYQQGADGWKREIFTDAAQTTHNAFPLTDFLGRTAGPLTEAQRTILDHGAADPAALKINPDNGKRANPNAQIWSIPLSASTTRADTIVRAETARAALLPAAFGARIERTFEANLPYNLMLDAVEKRVRELTPAAIRARGQTLSQALAPIRRWLETTTEIAVTEEAWSLGAKLGVLKTPAAIALRALGQPGFAALDALDALEMRVGAKVKVPERDRQIVNDDLEQHWYSWNPDGEALYVQARRQAAKEGK
jgi:pimeloyl-ACP methyl ester carboxylesterase